MSLYKRWQFLKFGRSPVLVVFHNGEGIPDIETFSCLIFRPHLIDKRYWDEYRHFSASSGEVIFKEMLEEMLKPLKKVTPELVTRTKDFLKILHNERQDLISNLEYLEAMHELEAYINE